MSYSAIVAAHTKSVWEMLNSVKASLVVPSQFLADYAARASLGGGKTFLIPNSVVVSEQVFAEQVGCLYVGRLSVEKGLGLILDAWASNPSLPVLQIAGEGPLEELVAQAAKSDPRIKFTGAFLQRRWQTSGHPHLFCCAHLCGMSLLAESQPKLWVTVWLLLPQVTVASQKSLVQTVLQKLLSLLPRRSL
jgi:glycosyltransferase involved in cell wall biosynthesis